MANLVEDETWEEVVDELAEEGGEGEEEEQEEGEEEEQLSPGYRAADGPYKPFCSCEDRITCSFCSWFHLVRDCQFHGKATKRPVKCCNCRKAVSDGLKLYSTDLQFVKSFRSQPLEESRQLETCDCRKTINEKCNCLEDVASSSSNSVWDVDPQPGYDISGDEIRGEGEIADGGPAPGSQSEEAEDFMLSKSEGSRLMNVNGPEVPSIKQELRQFRACTCEEEPKPRSGSSTELESSASGSSRTDSSSQIDMSLFEELEGSSDLSSSENSSAEGADIEWTRARWYHYASDRSVESVSDDGDYEERRRRRTAVKKLLTRHSRGSRRRRELPKKHKSTPHQYLVVQQSRKKNFLDICKDKKDQPHTNAYHLMRII